MTLYNVAYSHCIQQANSTAPPSFAVSYRREPLISVNRFPLLNSFCSDGASTVGAELYNNINSYLVRRATDIRVVSLLDSGPFAGPDMWTAGGGRFARCESPHVLCGQLERVHYRRELH
jgi:hypothetical protein